MSQIEDNPVTFGDRPIVTLGYVWVGDLEEGLRYLSKVRELGSPAAERIREMSYVELQGMSDDPNGHGRRRYSKGHYLTELGDAAIDAFLARGVSVNTTDLDWTRVPNGGFQAYGGAIADVGDDDGAATPAYDSGVDEDVPRGVLGHEQADLRLEGVEGVAFVRRP